MRGVGGVWRAARIFLAARTRSKDDIPDLPHFLFGVERMVLKDVFSLQSVNGDLFGRVEAEKNFAEPETLAFDLQAFVGDGGMFFGHVEESAFEIERLMSI